MSTSTPKIAVGGEDFVALRKAGCYYIDKTELLYKLVESNTSVTLFTRPRRFGKTLTMSMIESFFSVSTKDSSEVFGGLEIIDHSELCKEYMNRYPVLSISFKDVEGRTFDVAYAMLKAVIADICKKYTELETASSVLPADRDILHRLVFKTALEEDIRNSLKTLMRMLNAVYGRPVILLIDEYDVPLAKAYANGYYAQMLDVIRAVMSTSLKTNEYLKFAVVTGCLRIPKESIITGVNNFASYSVLDEDFAQYFGFTHEEVTKMLTDFGLQDKEPVLREWYDGYAFGGTEVYCPWDVVNYVSALSKRENASPRNYWENTSGNDAIKAFFDLSGVDISDKFETLLNGGTITERVTNSLTYDIAYTSENNLWNILLMTGYVTVAHEDETDYEGEGRIEVGLRIPNREIAGIFQTAVVDHFVQTLDEEQQKALMKALWDGDEDKASEILSDMLWNTISYMDYHEDYYHAFLAGIFVGRGGYAVKSNRERGLGQPDLDLRDKRNRRAIIIETKKADSEERMEYWCREALQQIRDNEYAANLDGYGEVLCYGISFYRKKALIKKG